jgi:OOP family OmpA-OmpF porin
MRTNRMCLAMCVAVLLAAGCKQEDAAGVDVPPAAAPAAEAAPQAEPPAIAPAQGFNMESLPVSTVALGAFPYLSLPTGVTNQGYGKTDKAFARFPFQVDGKSHWVEGRFHGETFYAEEGAEFSEFAFVKNFEGLIEQMGGRKVYEGKVPRDEIDAWGDEITQGFIDGLGDVYTDPVKTYVVRRNDGNIWIHLVTDNMHGGYVIGQEQAFQQTAKLLPAAVLKKQLDASGKVALQVNFATDKTEILPESLPQIDQVAQLLKEDDGLRLAVNGHTDNAGDAARNQTLSEGRAQSVVAAVAAKGVDAARMAAKGFGASQPVADNGTDAGRAQNRRVELVRQ